MENQANNEDVLVRYLLGELSDEEQTRIEQLFFTDDQYYEQLLAVENELRYDYAQGKLSGTRGRTFEKRFLASSDDRAQTSLAEELLKRLANGPSTALSEPAAEPVAVPETIIGRLRSLFALTATTRTLRLSLAAASLVAVLGAGWLIVETAKLRSQLIQLRAQSVSTEDRLGQQTEEERQRVAALTSALDHEKSERQRLEQELATEREQQRQQGTAPTLGSIVSFIISPGGVRGEGQAANELTLPKTAETVRLELKLKNSSAYESYRLTILTAEGKEIWSTKATHISFGEGSRRLIVKLPARRLSRGDYELDLKGQTNKRQFEEIDSYYFSIRTK
jgi:hypothetical protein